MARGYPAPAGRPGPARLRHGVRIRPASRAPDVAEHAGGPGARSSEQACDDIAYHPRATRTPPRPAAPRVRQGRRARTPRATKARLRPGHLGAAVRSGGFRRFDEHEVVLPLVVITELEGKRHHPELGWFARQSLRMLDDLRIHHGRLDHPVPVNDVGGTLRVELNHTDDGVLPPGFRTESNDARILSVALNLAGGGPRRHPGQQGHAAAGQGRRGRSGRRRYRHGQASDPTWTGMAEVEVGEDQVAAVRRRRPRPRRGGRAALSHRPGAALGAWFRTRPGAAGQVVRLVRGDREAFGLHGRSAEQRIALDLLLDETIGIVSLGGRAGTGKSALALCAGWTGDGAPPAQEGDCVPAAVRGRWPGAGLPARQRVGEDVAVGPGGLRHARRAWCTRTSVEEVLARACSRCCR